MAKQNKYKLIRDESLRDLMIVHYQQSYAIQSAGALFYSDILDVIVSKNCYSVSQKQIRGTEESQVITDTGIYKGFCHVLDMLNYFATVHPEISEEIEQTKALSDELAAKIVETAKEFKDSRC